MACKLCNSNTFKEGADKGCGVCLYAQNRSSVYTAVNELLRSDNISHIKRIIRKWVNEITEIDPETGSDSRRLMEVVMQRSRGHVDPKYVLEIVLEHVRKNSEPLHSDL